MAMLNMKITRKEMTEANPVDAMMPGDVPNYPYGLKICLDNDSLERLNFNIEKHKVGETGELKARYVIESMEARKTESGEEKEVRLQITDLGFDDKEVRWSIESRR